MDSLSSLSRKYKALLGGGVCVLGLLAVFAIFGSRGWRHLQRLQLKQERMEALAVRLEQQNARLREHLRRVETDDGYLERMVRERLGWVRSGEMVYRVEEAGAVRSGYAGEQNPRISGPDSVVATVSEGTAAREGH